MIIQGYDPTLALAGAVRDYNGTGVVVLGACLNLSMIYLRNSSGIGEFREESAFRILQTESKNNTSPEASTREELLIKPGFRVGPLTLGDTRERALALFPAKPGVDQESDYPNCGTEYEWVNLQKAHDGGVFIYFKERVVFQIGSATTRYHTKEGLTVGSEPETVYQYHKGLRSFELSGTASEVNGNRNLIFWVDREKGIAFAFAYDAKNRARTVQRIIIFKPNGDFCPEGESSDSPNWRELAPYSLEAPDANAD